ncbi:uncharacterized protein LOC126835737 isoform X2 [Adelges cooleyi]|uniref:uncharacterized protein LOC126835737 isoform X2 n=1 Tax=Adelges cooleyi TaxID=133065 RepID=UPI00217FA833|nr:uncharacterized protein LOC126835737 isoform X2 [Adelges cooleyi]
MQTLTPHVITAVCLLLAIRLAYGHVIDQGQQEQQQQQKLNEQAPAQTRGLDAQSMISGIANSLMSRTGGTSSQTLSLNVSNVMLMVVLKALIWGAAYMTGGHKGRKEESSSGLGDIISEADILMFLGFLVADDSGQYDCLNRVACEQPTKATSYLKSAEMVWNAAKILDGIVPMDSKYEKMLNRLQEAIEDGRANADCQAIYKCSEPLNDRFNNII